MRRRWLSNRIVSVVVSMLAAAVWAGIPQAAHAFTPIASGDLIVSLEIGPVREYTPSGTLVQTLLTANLPAGTAFDGNGNLFVTEFSGNDILRLDAVTGAVTVFSNNAILADGTSYHNPESVAFNAGFTKLYVSEVNRSGGSGPRGIHVLDAVTGAGLDYLPLPSSSGSAGQGQSDWLAFNASNTLFMTNENATQGVMQVNETTKDIVSPSFVPNLPNTGYAISFDKLGDVWIGDTNTVLEYSSAGALLKTITNTNFSVVFAAVFNPAGDTFYAGDLGNGNVYTYDLNGTLLGTFNAGSGVSGLSVAGASLPNQSSVTTSLSGGGHSGPAITVPPGTAVTDSATLTGANAANAGGTVTYTVYAEPTCTVNGVSAGTKPVTAGVVPNSDSLTLNGPNGTVFYWQAVYSGDPATHNSPSMSVCGSETVTIFNPEQPIAATGTNVSATEGALFAGQVASFTDPTATATAAEYTASITWGDGNTSTGFVSGPPGGPFTVTGSNTYAEEGTTYTVTVTITDIDNAANGATTTSTATVSDAALSASCAVVSTSSQSFSGLTATFTDAASPFGTLSDFTAMIHWGDGTTSTGTVTGLDGGPYSVSGSHAYTSTGPFTITTTINDVGGSTASTPGCSGLVFAFAPGGGSFVIGNNNSANGKKVTFWGAQWWKLNSLSGGSAPASFKGFAEAPTTPACGTGWSTDTGNSTPPPAGPLPAFMGVIVTSSATQSGSIDSGNTVHIVVVQTNPGYQPNPGNPGTGTVVAQVC